MMTDVWCFTCNHEIREVWPGEKWKHANGDDYPDCPCVIDGLECQP